ncbi:ABC transporter permease [Kibdelosporangium sp. 4NS15]|uniref:ABC transporter permease n=1 Tax=Kibdelosporangium persicum TaxID=2698649 RepID=A0ABX2F1E2_9PSEU|nr:ABC transporter permease [Kibdelosporangium persicum]
MTVVVSVVTGLVLAFVAAATVFYTSASGSAATQYAVGHRCAVENGVQFTVSNADMPADNARLRAIAGSHGAEVARSRVYVAAGPLDPVRLVSRDGAFDHVEVLRGGDRNGVWIPHNVAEQFKVEPGGVISIARQPVPVGAVYRKLADPVPEYWCADRGVMVPPPHGGTNDPPQPLLVPERLLDELPGIQPLGTHVEVYTRKSLRTRTEIEDWATATGKMTPEVIAALNEKPVIKDYAAVSAKTAGQTQDTVSTAVLPLTLISLLAGLLGVVGLAAQWIQRRGAEVRLLWTRGVSAQAIGGKAVLEMGGPLLLGVTLGWATAWLTSPVLAPAPQLDPWAPSRAAMLAAATWLVALAVLGTVTSLRARREFTAIERKRDVLKKIPWEVLAGAGAVTVWLTGADHAVRVDPASLLPEVSLAALAFPLLCIVFFIGVTARLAGFLSKASHRLRGWRNPTVLWALRRTAAQRKVAVALLAVAGLAIGVIAAGVGVAKTARESLEDKGWMRIGSDHAVPLVRGAGEQQGVPQELRGQATRIAYTQLYIEGNIGARILLIDPETFQDGGRWRDRWAGTGLDELTARLAEPPTDGTIPVIVAGRYPLDQFIGQADYFQRMRTVATVPSFPAIGQYEGMIITSWQWLTPSQRRGFSQQILTTQDPRHAVDVLNAAGERTGPVLDAKSSTEHLPFLIVAWIFAFFVVLGAALAAVAVVTLLVSVETRRRSTAVAHALLARMGLRAGALLATHLVELAILAGAATAVGVGGGWVVLEVLTQRLDPFPALSPVPQPASLRGVGLMTSAVAIAGVVLVAGYAVRAAKGAKVRELLRA